MTRTLVLGDIHGNHKALKDVFKACSFDFDNDNLILLGDIVDGHSDTKKCVDLLLTVTNKIFCLGNHDWWFLKWLDSGDVSPGWYNQGGKATLTSYGVRIKNYSRLIPSVDMLKTEVTVPTDHQAFFGTWVPYHLDEKNRLFVHGGFKYTARPRIPIDKQELQDLIWDRDLIDRARGHPITDFEHVWVGHTSTINKFGSDTRVDNCMVPLTFNNLTMMDTGAGWDGKLSIMDIDTREYWQSKIYGMGR